MSKSEEKIEQIFYNEEIPCIREKTFKDLKQGKLRYDFYLPSMEILVEYDSEIHFKEVPKFHSGYEDFKKACERDRIKNTYALSHNIPLYRVPFYDFYKIKRVVDILNPKYLVKNKWHNDTLRHELASGGKI